MHTTNKLNINNALVLAAPTMLILLSLGSYFYTILGAIYFLVIISKLFMPSIINLLINTKVNKSNIYGYLLMLLVFYCYLQGYLNNTIEINKAILLCLIWLIYFLSYIYLDEQSYDKSILWQGIIFYVVLNFVLWLIGLTPPSNAYSETGDAKMLSMIGVRIDRIQFPLTLGINGFGVISGLASALSIAHVLNKKSLLNFTMSLICLLVLLLTDSRGALAGFIVTTSAIILLYYSMSKVKASVISLIAIFSYPCLSYIIYSIFTDILGAFSGLSRSGGPLSGRDIIWEGFYDFLKSTPRDKLLFGYGYLGQVSSGVSQSYMTLFAHLNNLKEETVNVHSSFYQLLLDMGLVGVIMIMVILSKLLYVSSVKLSHKDYSGLYGFSFVIYGVFVGATDLTFNQNNLVFFYLIVAVSAIGLRNTFYPNRQTLSVTISC